MVVPKINFIYSWVYDDHLKIWTKPYQTSPYPSPKQTMNFMKKLEKLWRKREKKILTEMSRISGLKWKSRVINCFVVGRCIPFSMPLTIPVFKSVDYAVDTLTHELLHNILYAENIKETRKAWQYIYKKYKCQRITLNHIPLYAVHIPIYLTLFNKKRLDVDRERSSKRELYKASWDIVDREGYKNIIKEFKKRIRN